MSCRSVVLLFPLLSFWPAFGAELGIPAQIEFNRDVRPVLADNCFACHGPDAANRQAKLRLDVREAALAKEAFFPGKPAESELVVRIRSQDEDEMMPPPDSHKKLSARDKAVLARWIAQGAEYQNHWAYEPPVKAAIPAGANAIDTLVARRLITLQTSLSDPKLGGMKSRFSSPGFAEKIHWARDAGG